MSKKEAMAGRRKKWEFSFLPVLRYNLLFCGLIVVIIALSGVLQTVRFVQDSVRLAAEGAQARVSYRVEQSMKVLSALAARQDFSDPSVPILKKSKSLDEMNTQMGYMMMRFVDADINVHSSKGVTSLASREYMQRLFGTGKTQVTDSFAAGADGTTFNYTVAVPLHYQGQISGALFCAIYFDEVANVLKESNRVDGVETVLLGSKSQMMSASSKVNYGDSYIDLLRNERMFGATLDQVEANLLGSAGGAFWSLQGGTLAYTMYAPVQYTGWKIIATGNFNRLYWAALQGLLPILLLSIALCGLLVFLVNRYVRQQMQIMDTLVQSLQELEQKIYQDDRPDEVDLTKIIQLTSTGLSDGLTGVVTRTVFLNKLKAQLPKLPQNKLAALCFVDLDDLKKLNDTYGHKVGDLALKSIGYILREYEKKYDGLVGRYGGDEFVLLLSDLDSEMELGEVLDDLTLRLQCDISEKNEIIRMHCSIGVAVRKQDEPIERWIEKADEALYFVKQNGKSYYKIYQD